MKKMGRTEEQKRFIELNKQFMKEVENGASWNELRWLIEEMKKISKNFEHLETATIIAMDDRSERQDNNASMERIR